MTGRWGRAIAPLSSRSLRSGSQPRTASFLSTAQSSCGVSRRSRRSPSSIASAPGCGSCNEGIGSARVPHLGWNGAVLSTLAGGRTESARRNRAVPSRTRALGTRGASRQRARARRLRVLRVGCARPRALPRPRGLSPRLGTSIRDVGEFIAEVSKHSGLDITKIAVIAQSVGAVLVSAWLHDYAPRIRCAVLASPAFKVKLYVPLARTGLALMHRTKGNFFVKSYVKAKFLTHDPERIASFDVDPLITRDISANILLALYETAERVVADANAIPVPLQLLISGSDFVVHHAPQHDFFNRLGSPIKERHVLDGFFHDTLGERDRELALKHVRRFIGERFTEAQEVVDVTRADRSGHTREESDRLATPLPKFSPRGLYWSATRLGIKVGGLLSKGLALGQQTGFDSGSTLDYVYENQPRGRTALGRLIDHNYLQSIGW